jgi:hypothetical protein
MKNQNVESKSINSFLKRVLSLTIILVLGATSLSNAQTGKVNFSGTWALNAEKSTQPEGGGGMRMGGGDFVAKQEANLLTVDRTRTNQNGETVTTNMKYTLDGKESVNTSQRGDSKSVATWSTDGKTLTILTTRTTQYGEMKTTEVWTLPDAKTISIVTTFTTPDGDRKSTMVYDKK